MSPPDYLQPRPQASPRPAEASGRTIATNARVSVRESRRPLATHSHRSSRARPDLKLRYWRRERGRLIDGPVASSKPSDRCCCDSRGARGNRDRRRASCCTRTSSRSAALDLDGPGRSGLCGAPRSRAVDHPVGSLPDAALRGRGGVPERAGVEQGLRADDSRLARRKPQGRHR